MRLYKKRLQARNDGTVEAIPCGCPNKLQQGKHKALPLQIEKLYEM